MIERFEMYFEPSREKRMVSIYLPPDYAYSSEAYPVMYMFDGQNAFEDGVCAYGTALHMHAFLDGWEKRMIAVALQSSAECDRRMAEYCPYHLAPRLWEGLRGRGRATMEWITGTLLPHINSRYRTLTDRTCTGVTGVSMGAVMALYAATAYNGVFSKAGCMSPALAMGHAQILQQIRAQDLNPDTRVFLSWGENEARDRRMLAHTTSQSLAVTNLLSARGVRTYPYIQEEGRHCEADWKRQLPDMMRFLWLQ